MRTIKKWLTVAVMFICCSTISAYDFVVDGIYYNITSPSELTCEVTFYSESSSSNAYKGKIVIPTTVNYSGKTYNVIGIGKKAFYWNTGLTSIVISETITSIGYQAFDGCYSLTSVIIPKNVINIDNYAFGYCTKLKEVFILGKPTVAYNAFSDCHSALEVYYGKDMVTFDENISNYGDTHNVSYTNNLKAYTATLHDYELETDAGTHTTNLMFTYFDGVNFDVEIPYTYTINKAPLTIKVNDAEKVYGDENPQFTYSVSGFVNNEDESALSSEVSFATTAEKGSKVGTYICKCNC